MAISQKRYVDITSATAGRTVNARELIARLMTTNELAPAGKVLEFSSLNDVAAHFTTNSKEYAFASKYFGWISKGLSNPRAISFARWTPEGEDAKIISMGKFAPVTSFTGAFGGFEVDINGVKKVISVTFDESVTTYAAVCEAITDAIQDADTAFANAVLEYRADQHFELSVNGENAVVGYCSDIVPEIKAPNTNYNLAALLALNATSNPVIGFYNPAETPVAGVARTTSISDNFGSFAFLDKLEKTEMSAVADWTAAQNVRFIYSVGLTAADVEEFVQDACADKNGVCVTLATDGGYEEFIPMTILASTDYNRAGAAQNYMFQVFDGVTPSVTDDEKANAMDAIKVNYYGLTQSAGKGIAFYQRGVLQGAISDIGVFANEIWLKDQFAVEILSLFLKISQIPASQRGLDMIRCVLADKIELAITNGTILPSKELTSAQKLAIDNLAGESESWVSVYTNGYKLAVSLVTPEEGGTEYRCDYVLIYSKGDSIRKVTGTHVLI